MKASRGLGVAVSAHALLIGLLMGMSKSPIVGVVLPLLMGVGGYKLLDFVTSPASNQETNPNSLWRSSFAWLGALWCVVVIAALIAGVAFRNGIIPLGSPAVTTMSLVRLE